MRISTLLMVLLCAGCGTSVPLVDRAGFPFKFHSIHLWPWLGGSVRPFKIDCEVRWRMGFGEARIMQGVPPA